MTCPTSNASSRGCSPRPASWSWTTSTGSTNGQFAGESRRFSPPVVRSEHVRVIEGAPDEGKISTSYVERSNLTMRMGMRRMTRLTNGFSKKIENLSAAVALHFMYYNFARPHKTLGGKITPAMAAGLSDHCWTVEEICQLLESN